MDKEEFIKRRWYVQGFNATPNLISLAAASALKQMVNHLGYGYSCMMNSFKNDFCEYYYSWADLENIYKKVFAFIKENPKYLDEQEEYQRKIWSKGLKVAYDVRNTDLKTLNKAELFKLYQEIFEWYPETASVSHLIESFVLMDEELKDKLVEYYEKSDKKEKFNVYFTKLTQPIRPSFTNDETISLLKIIKFIKENSVDFENQKLLKLLEDHRNEFYWVRCNYADGEESTLEYFIKEVKSLLARNVDPVSTLKEEDAKYEFNKKEKERVLSELDIKDEKTLLMIKLSEQLLHFQDDRKKVILTILCNLNKVLYEIAERYNLDKRLILYLRAEEVLQEIVEKMTNEQLQERKNGCMLLWERTGNQKGEYGYDIEILVGKESEDFILKLKEEEKEEINDFRGMCASTGNAIGKVRICRTKEDLLKFEEGEVLVTSMTRPEFVSAMKKATAIITDEGGITCHAAIISRELSIPCIIGTKIATRVLKDGDLVEVRANHSLIKIIKRK